jgi:hypothetical protein
MKAETRKAEISVLSFHNSSFASQFRLIDETPPPILAGFKGLDNGMVARMKVFPGVPMGRRITTADVTACQA